MNLRCLTLKLPSKTLSMPSNTAVSGKTEVKVHPSSCLHSAVKTPRSNTDVVVFHTKFDRLHFWCGFDATECKRRRCLLTSALLSQHSFFCCLEVISMSSIHRKLVEGFVSSLIPRSLWWTAGFGSRCVLKLPLCSDASVHISEIWSAASLKGQKWVQTETGSGLSVLRPWLLPTQIRKEVVLS